MKKLLVALFLIILTCALALGAVSCEELPIDIPGMNNDSENENSEENKENNENENKEENKAPDTETEGDGTGDGGSGSGTTGGNVTTVCQGCGGGTLHEKCIYCFKYTCVGDHSLCYPNEPCFCGGGTFEGNQWMHAKCPECEKYICEDHELCANCNEYIGCASYCPSCHLHYCYHPKEICEHCGGELSWCEEEDKLSQLRDHYTLCEICNKYRCEGDYDAHKECDMKLKDCPECREEGAREEHKCANCDGYTCDGLGDAHYMMCPNCSEYICEDENIHGKTCDNCGAPLCQGDHDNCEGQDPGQNNPPAECNHVTDGGTLKFYEAKDPTCNEVGWYNHYRCDICNWYFSEDGKTTGSEHDKVIIIGTVSCDDKDADELCDWCKQSMIICEGCGVRGVTHELCECGMYVCVYEHDVMCTKGKDTSRFCDRCKNNLPASSFHDDCGYCLDCCTCGLEIVCDHTNTSPFLMNCGYNMQYEHRKCNDCGKVLCVVYNEIGVEMFECYYCDPNIVICNHTPESMTSTDVDCVSGRSHYYCSNCQGIFLYNEMRGAYTCGICGNYGEANTCASCYGAAETLCGSCNQCQYCCSCIGEEDKEEQKFCSGCYNAVTSVCERCEKCSECCACSERVDITQYCPRCASDVTVFKGHDASCLHPGMRDTYSCQKESCGYSYMIINGTDVATSGEESGILGMIEPYGHNDSDGNYACDRCHKLYDEEKCVFCGGANPCFECMHIYEGAVCPVSWGGVNKYQTDGGNWVKIEVHYSKESSIATLKYSLRYTYGDNAEYTEYADIITVTCSAYFVTNDNYVLALTPVSAEIHRRNLLDNGWSSAQVESFGVDTGKISYVMLTEYQTNYDDNMWAPNDNIMGVVLNLPFTVCSSCDGIFELGVHGVCESDGCGKNLCAGHIHGVCDHDNKELCSSICGDCTDHYYCSDCGTYLRAMYEGSGYFLEECVMCKEYESSIGEGNYYA